MWVFCGHTVSCSLQTCPCWRCRGTPESSSLLRPPLLGAHGPETRESPQPQTYWHSNPVKSKSKLISCVKQWILTHGLVIHRIWPICCFYVWICHFICWLKSKQLCEICIKKEREGTTAPLPHSPRHRRCWRGQARWQWWRCVHDPGPSSAGGMPSLSAPHTDTHTHMHAAGYLEATNCRFHMTWRDLNVAQFEGSLCCTSSFTLRGFMWESYSP